MTDQLASFRAQGSPLRDAALPVDAFVSVAPAGPGAAVVTTASGLRLQARLTTPRPGVLRLRLSRGALGDGQSPMLTAFEDRPAEVRVLPDGDGVTISAGGLEAVWTTGQGLRLGPVRTPAMFPSGHIDADGRERWLLTAGLQPDAEWYGGGENFQGPRLRGRLLRGVNSECDAITGFDTSYLTVPFYWCDRGWGLLVHTGAPVLADIGAGHAETAAFLSEGPELDVFWMLGSPVELLRSYHALTGLPGRFPDWGYGVWFSRCSYLSASEVLDTVDRARDAGCPVDVVHLDGWMRGNLMRDLTCHWEGDHERFPEGWSEALRERGVRLSLWHNPYVTEREPLADELAGTGLLLADASGAPAPTSDRHDRHLLDFTRPEAVAWWEKAVTRALREEGAVALKADFAEEVPPDAVTADGRPGWQIRNLYSLLYQRAGHEALRAHTGSDAVAMFCRSGTTGAQRYPCHWVGDTPSTWDGMAGALRACLSLSLSGFALVATDVGGFLTTDGFDQANDAFARWDPEAYRADVDPDLFVRWTQLGALSPVMRFHGMGRREPDAYPEPWRSHAIAACRLRDRLRGYLVRAGEQAAADGTPVLRPMVLATDGAPESRGADLQYLLGPDVLVAPVLTPGGDISVWVPEGRWEPLCGLDPVEGPGWVRFDDIPLDRYPAWVRAGAKVID